MEATWRTDSLWRPTLARKTPFLFCLFLEFSWIDDNFRVLTSNREGAGRRQERTKMDAGAQKLISRIKLQSQTGSLTGLLLPFLCASIFIEKFNPNGIFSVSNPE